MRYSSDVKEVKEFTMARSVMYNLVLSIFITLVLGVIAIYVFSLRLDIVLSDSMAPTFYKDDIVVIKPCNDYKVGDMIEFRTAAKEPVCHRITQKTGSGNSAVYITKGDNNNNNDLSTVSASSINGKVIIIVEDGKNIYDFIKSNYFLFIDIILGIWVLSATLTGESEMRKHDIARAE